uniref:Uncharacterized protein n=2 Tax=Aegilops tauschii subsp. strangulata TaxID=200361 RepID=A0A453Q6E6_AEGTS
MLPFYPKHTQNSHHADQPASLAGPCSGPSLRPTGFWARCSRSCPRTWWPRTCPARSWASTSKTSNRSSYTHKGCCTHPTGGT